MKSVFAFYLESASLIKDTFGNLFKAFIHLPYGGVYNLVPVRHAIAYESGEILEFYFQFACQFLCFLSAYNGTSGAVVAFVVVVGVLDADYEFTFDADAGIKFPHDRLVIV